MNAKERLIGKMRRALEPLALDVQRIYGIDAAWEWKAGLRDVLDSILPPESAPEAGTGGITECEGTVEADEPAPGAGGEEDKVPEPGESPTAEPGS